MPASWQTSGVRSLTALLRSCHPEPTVAVSAVCTGFAISAGRGWGAGWVAAAVLAGQLSVGWSNDYLDRERDGRTGRTDKPVAAGAVPAVAVRNAAAIALVSGAGLSFGSGPLAAGVHIVGIAAAWAYNLRLKSTLWSPAPYAVGFGALAAFVVLGLPGHPVPPAWLVVAVALLGVGAHFANVLPDLQDDLRTGVRGLPHRLGPRWSAIAAAGFLLAASALLTVGPGDPGALGVTGLAVAAGLVAAVALAARRPGSRAPFRISILIALLDVAALIARGSSF
jgi:4-hydroxybenzoate polyprenyltransferase